MKVFSMSTMQILEELIGNSGFQSLLVCKSPQNFLRLRTPEWWINTTVSLLYFYGNHKYILWTSKGPKSEYENSGKKVSRLYSDMIDVCYAILLSYILMSLLFCGFWSAALPVLETFLCIKSSMHIESNLNLPAFFYRLCQPRLYLQQQLDQRSSQSWLQVSELSCSSQKDPPLLAELPLANLIARLFKCLCQDIRDEDCSNKWVVFSNILLTGCSPH